MADIKLDKGGWVLVADGERAEFYRNAGDAQNPKLEAFKDMSHEMKLDTESHRSTMHESDHDRIPRERFAKEIAERLYKSAHAGKFEQLVIIASPAVLGPLRQELHKEVERRVLKDISKDLAGRSADEVHKAVFG